MNSFLYLENITDYNNKNGPLNCICHIKRKYINGNNDNHILYNMRQKKMHNNHLFYSKKELSSNKTNNLSEINPKTNRRELYISNSKSKEEECKSNINTMTNFKTKNHNYHNINTNSTYHSCDKNQIKAIPNEYDKNKKHNNIRLIEHSINTINSPRINDKSKNFVYQNNQNNLSKTLNNFKNRDNCGYHEIKEVKKNKLATNSNNSKHANEDKKIQNKITSNYNKYIRSSLIINSNDKDTVIKKNNDNNNNTNKISHKRNNMESNKNINDRNYRLINFKTTQSYFNPPKNVVKEENKYSSNKKYKENHKEHIINNSNKKYNDANKNYNLNDCTLMEKLYKNNTTEEKRKKNICLNKNGRNNHNSLNINEKDKNIINTKRFFSGDLNEYLKESNNNDNIKTKRKIYYCKRTPNNCEKLYTPIKTEITQKDKHTKRDSYSSFITNSTDNIITKPNKPNSKYDIGHIFKKIDKFNIKKIISSRKSKNENKNQNTCKINALNENMSKNNSLLLKNDKRTILIKDNNINKEKEIKESNIQNWNEKNNNNQKKNNNIKNKKNNEIKDNKNFVDKNKINNLENNEINKEAKKTIINIKKYNNPFNNSVINRRKDLTDTNKNKNNKEINKKRCKSSDKEDKDNHKFRNKNITNKKILEKVRKQRSRTKSKSKSNAKKHSAKIKYLDKLKIFKYSETSYNICYDSSTNCSNNIDNKYKKYALITTRSPSKKKKNINSFNLNYKSFEEDFKINKKNMNEKYLNIKPQLSVRITLCKKNNVNVVGILRYFKVNYLFSENLRNKYDVDSEDTSEYYNAKF